MDVAVVLFTRDLRVDDHPALAEACRSAERVLPLFVLDKAILNSRYAAPNRLAFLLESLHDLRRALRRLGGDLVVRRGDPVDVTAALVDETGAAVVFDSADVTALAAARERRLDRVARRQRFEVRHLAGVTVVPPGELVPAGGDHFKVFTPYWQAWRRHPWRPEERPPPRVELPDGVQPGIIPELRELTEGRPSPRRPEGGAEAGHERLRAWRDRARGLAGLAEAHDLLADDVTSRLSPYLHFGCLSPLSVARDANGRAAGSALVRQLCWRDFHHQVTAAYNAIARRDYRSRGDRWRWGRDAEADFDVWREGRTGYPIVDAAMRQLRQEGWLPNRARLVVASFLVKDLYIDWRLGADHFLHWLVDGDIANNSGNWQWVAGTGNDTRPHRVFNPTRQAERFDPDGDYVRRYVPQLASIEGRAIHQPWRLGPLERLAIDYPEPVIAHDDAMARFRRRRRV
jgi:deoxyribodipyrimidine photo-lyase